MSPADRPEPPDYRDYVIREGRFIGDFERMYRDCPDPWRQDEVVSEAESVALAMLEGLPIESILDLGCGKGRFSSRLAAATGADVVGVDVSPTAVAQANARFPELRFVAASIPPLAWKDARFDLVVAAELLWYVLPRLEELFTEIDRVLAPGGHLLLIQQFYQEGEQGYGREVMTRPEDLLPKVPLALVQRVDLEPRANHKLVALFRART